MDVGTPVDVVMAHTFIDVSLAFRKEIEKWDCIEDPAEKLQRGFSIQDSIEHVSNLRAAIDKQILKDHSGSKILDDVKKVTDVLDMVVIAISFLR